MKKTMCRFLLFVVIVMGSFFVLEMSIGDLRITTFLSRIIRYKKITLISVTFISSISIILLSVFNNRIFAYISYFLLMISLAIANSQKIKFRQEPLFPHDLKESLNIVDLLKMMSKVDQFIAFILIFFVIGLFFLLRKIPTIQKYKVAFTNNKKRLVALLFSVLIALLISGVNAFNSPLNNLINSSGFVDYKWNQLQTYQENGTVISFVKNFPGITMKKPTNYNSEKMNHIYEKYRMLAEKINTKRLNDELTDINVVYILSESLANPNRLENISLSENPLAYIQDDTDKNLTGKLLVNAYGGGTANVEFEVLTSFSTSFLLPNMSLPYQNILAYKPDFPSIVSLLKSPNRKAIAAHSYHSRFYQRRKVFKNLKFDTQLFEDDFYYNEPLENGYYISDDSSYKEILRILDDESSLFLHFITMQNHTPYQNIFDEYVIDIDSPIENNLEEIKYYVESLRQTDQATKKFIEHIKQSEKKTIVVLYGDHLPPLYSDFLSENDKINKYTTDFFIFSNYTGKNLLVEEPVSTYYINNLVYELADMKISPFMAFIEVFNREFSGISGNEFLLKSGEIKTYEQLNSYQQELVDEYILIQYDAIDGYCYFWKQSN